LKYTELQLEGLKEIFNIGIGKGAEVLNTMLSTHILLSVPEMVLVDKDNFESLFSSISNNELSVVSLDFSGNFSGSSCIVFPSESANKLLTSFLDQEIEDLDLDLLKSSSLTEIGNVVLNSVVGTFANILNLNFNYLIPTFQESTIDELIPNDKYAGDSTIVVAKAQFTLASFSVNGDIILFFELGSFDKLISLIDNYLKELEAY
jgi:chemotaxis protein CheC